MKIIIFDDEQSDFGAIVAMIIIDLFLVICALGGLTTISDYGDSFVQYLFSSFYFYFCIVVIIVLNTGLFFAKVSVIDTGITEAIIGFLVYIVLGCIAYSTYGEWEVMSDFLEQVCSFFGIVWMSLLMSVISTLVCVGAAVLICKLENIGTKRSGVSDKEATKKTVEDYIKKHTDGYGSFRPESGDVWRCSFCKEWEAMSYKQCNKCGQFRKYRDKVKYAKKRR